MRITSSLTAPQYTAALLTLVLSASFAEAQMKSPPRMELRPFVGAFVPTGDQSDILTNGITAGAQAAYAFNRHLSAVGTFAWSSSETKTFGSEDINVFQYDIGAELGADKSLTPLLSVRPFVGVGMGGRSYDYQDRDQEAQHNVAGYGSAGAQLQLGRLGWRLEARDYVSGFNGLSGEMLSTKTRNDLTFASGLTFKF